MIRYICRGLYGYACTVSFHCNDSKKEYWLLWWHVSTSWLNLPVSQRNRFKTPHTALPLLVWQTLSLSTVNEYLYEAGLPLFPDIYGNTSLLVFLLPQTEETLFVVCWFYQGFLSNTSSVLGSSWSLLDNMFPPTTQKLCVEIPHGGGRWLAGTLIRF